MCCFWRKYISDYLRQMRYRGGMVSGFQSGVLIVLNDVGNQYLPLVNAMNAQVTKAKREGHIISATKTSILFC